MIEKPLHLAIIPDGNGRWAAARGLPRAAGYEAGAGAVYRLLTAAAEQGVSIVTFFAFSSDNWERPAAEVQAMLRVFEEFLVEESLAAAGHGLRISVIGRRDRLPRELRNAISAAEEATQSNRGLHLRLAIDYSARDAILRAACRMYTSMEITRAAFSRLLRGVQPEGEVPDVDLLIRTGGEQRLSDFLLWECAYAELYFTPTSWPDFSAADLQAALAEYASRDRRFGRTPHVEPEPAAAERPTEKREPAAVATEQPFLKPETTTLTAHSTRH